MHAGKELVVFDFDKTILDCNSDTYINALAPNERIPSELWDQYRADRNWTAYMQRVFVYLHQNGVRRQEYERCLATMPFVHSMKSLLTSLASYTDNFELIIISDANTFFIEHTLKCNQLDHAFRQVITNRSQFDSDGCLRLEPCHHQLDCPLSPPNMCKGALMMDYINRRQNDQQGEVTFERINYIGDGSNDLCPSLRLSPNDRVFPRIGYAMADLVAQRVQSKQLSAQVYPFVSGDDIWKVLSPAK